MAGIQMAHITTHTPDAPSIHGMVQAVLASIGAGLTHMIESNSKVRLAQALAELSDAELADRGLKRSEIAHFVFADSYWV
jgi:uncharacterized protein YjiS (DUF1127 family)